MANEHKTAIARNKPSKPVRKLVAAGQIVGRTLDYGCGRGKDTEYLDCEGFDPYYRPELPVAPFATIVCNYVLNVIESDVTRREVLRDIDDLLADDGFAYIAVRANRKDLRGRTAIGTWQGLIVLDLPTAYKDSDTVIYVMRKGGSDCAMQAVVA